MAGQTQITHSYTHARTQTDTESVLQKTMCNISFCNVDSKVDQYFQPTLYIIVIVLGLPTNCMALWAAYMQVRRGGQHTNTHTRTHTHRFECHRALTLPCTG